MTKPARFTREEARRFLGAAKDFGAGKGEGESEMSEWQPIETAPKDGTEIALWFPIPDGGLPYGGEAAMNAACICIGKWDEILDDWDVEHIDDEATHWMPLPPWPVA